MENNIMISYKEEGINFYRIHHTPKEDDLLLVKIDQDDINKYNKDEFLKNLGLFVVELLRTTNNNKFNLKFDETSISNVYSDSSYDVAMKLIALSLIKKTSAYFSTIEDLLLTDGSEEGERFYTDSWQVIKNRIDGSS